MYRVSLPWAKEKKLLIKNSDTYIIYDWENRKLVRKINFPKSSENIDFHTTSRNVAYTIKNNLYVNDKRITVEPEGVV